MVDDTFFDAFIGYGAGFLPGLQSITINTPSGGIPAGGVIPLVLEGRIEGVSDQQRVSMLIAADEEAVTWFIEKAQPGYVRPYVGWKITQASGMVWVVKGSDETIQQRASICVCTKVKA